MTKTKQSETDIQRTICDYLALRKRFFWRNNNTPIYDPKRQAFRAMPKYTMRGIPDIIIIHEGNFIGLEVKGKGGKLSSDQLIFQKRCFDECAEYHVVRSLEDVKELGL